MAQTKVIKKFNPAEKIDFLIDRRFKVLKRLGKGGMGEIFLADDLKLKRKVAIKKIPVQNVYGNSSKARFLREAQTASQLSHPNICTIYEIYEEEENDYIVMQYIDGVTLDRIIEIKTLSVDKILNIAIQICNGMMEANEKGVIHRDLKPGNIMVDRRGNMKILDFGLAKIKGGVELQQNGLDDTNITAQGFVIGTISYMSPEQARGEALDLRSDIFSFGSVLYEMLEGKDPFQDSEQIGILYNILNKSVEFSRQLPDELEAIILKMLAKNPEDRFADFSQLKHALEDFQYRYLGSGAHESVESGELNEFIRQQTLLKNLKASEDDENFEDIVSQIKRLKTTTGPRPRTSHVRLSAYAVMAAVIFILLYFLFNHVVGTGPGNFLTSNHEFFVLVDDFQNKTEFPMLSPQITYLVAHSLNQYPEFKVITRHQLGAVLGEETPEEIERRLRDTGAGHSIKYKLSGSISRIKEIINIDASLEALGDTANRYSITVPGLEGFDSLLLHQVDTLCKQVYMKLDIRKRVDVDFKRSAKIFGESWDWFSSYFEGLMAWNKLKSSEAAAHFRAAGNTLAANVLLADLFIVVGLHDRARAHLNVCLEQIDDLTRGFQLKVKAMDAHLRFDSPAELKYLNALIQEHPFSERTYFNLGEAYFNQGDVETAIPLFEKALRLNPGFSRAMNRLGYCYSHSGLHRQALEYFEMYRHTDNSPNSFDSLGDGYFYSGDLVSSEACKKMAYTMEDRMVFWCYRILVDISVLKAEFHKAEELVDNYSQFRDSNDLKADMMATKAFIYYNDRRFLKALNAIDQAIKLYDVSEITSNSPKFHWLRGLILLALDHRQESKNELYWLLNFRQKFNLSSENFSPPYKYYVHLGALVLESEEEIQKADEAFRFLLNLKTRLSYRTTYFYYQFFHTEYARFLMRNQLYWRALEEIDKCLEFNRNYIPALWVKGELLERTKPIEAKGIYRKIAELYGHSAENNHLRRLLKRKLESRFLGVASAK